MRCFLATVILGLTLAGGALAQSAPQGAGQSPGPRLRIVATQGSVLGEGGVAGGGGTNYTRGESRIFPLTGAAAAYNIQLAYANYFANAASGEADNANAVTIEACFETLSPSAYYRAYFNGSTSVSLAAGAALVLTDPRGFDVAANTRFAVRTGVTVPSTQTWMNSNGIFGEFSGTGFFQSTSASSQVAAVGAMTTPGGGAAATSGYTPIAILGYTTQPIVSIVIMGDSLANGYQDAGDGLGASGWIERGLSNVNGAQIPWAQASKSGNTVNAEQVPQFGPRKRSLLDYATHAILVDGTNDLVVGTPVATLETQALNVFAGIRSHGVKLYVSTILPRTTSTDSWATAANQTAVNAAFASGGARDQFNTWLFTQIGVTIDGVIDPNPYLEDPVNHGKWVTNGTANFATPDGVHPGTAGHILAATAVANAAAKFAPTR